MSVSLAISNRKGGVGKSTVATIIAHAFATWGEMRVLVVDLDSQVNASLILVGGENWVRARAKDATLADFIARFFPQKPIEPDEYILREVGDVLAVDGGAPHLCLMPGSLDIEEREHEILHSLAQNNSNLYEVEQAVKGRITTLLRHVVQGFDLVIIDCPPGISFATQAALAAADRVIVPFRPDYVSLFAVDRIARMIENAFAPRKLEDIPKERRKYVTLANMYQDKSVHNRLVDEIAVYHPILNTRIPQRASIANAFDWEPRRRRLEQKYGNATPYVQRLYEELLPIVKGVQE